MSVTAPRGFLASGIACGLKANHAPDLALVRASAGAVSAAATFTTNLAAAAPVQVSREHLERSGGVIAAIVLNSGGANAATGAAGLSDARRTCAVVADHLKVQPHEILACSTGLIGIPLNVEAITTGIPRLVAELGNTQQDAHRAARAIMTTDTRPKEVVVEANGFCVGGMAKGAGMISPNMATMLAVLTTDAQVSPSGLSAALRQGVSASFNELTVDGCTSTNDTVAILASGAAGRVDLDELADAITKVCAGLAHEIAADAEGTTKVATIRVVGATSSGDVRLVARGVASSLLVKTSLFGADPYWGRIVSELGASGAAFSLDQVSIAYGPHEVVRLGAPVAHDDAALRAYLAESEIEITCDLGLGAGNAKVLTTDLGHGYIEENMRTS